MEELYDEQIKPATNSLEKLLQTTRFYLLSVQEFRKADVEIEYEITDEELNRYDAYLHEHIFPGENPE